MTTGILVIIILGCAAHGCIIVITKQWKKGKTHKRAK